MLQWWVERGPSDAPQTNRIRAKKMHRFSRSIHARAGRDVTTQRPIRQRPALLPLYIRFARLVTAATGYSSHRLQQPQAHSPDQEAVVREVLQVAAADEVEHQLDGDDARDVGDDRAEEKRQPVDTRALLDEVYTL